MLRTAPRSTPQPAGRRWPLTPWTGRPTRVDVALVAAVAVVVAIGMVTRPVTPFLLASHPVLLALLTGDKAAIGAAAAFAGIGEGSVTVVVAAGVIGTVSFNWITWWAGRQWGTGMIRMVTTSDRVLRVARRAGDLNPWVVRSAIVLAGLPGVPSAVVFAVAGMSGMRLRTFLLLDLAGATWVTAVVAGIGYALGRRAVDVVLLVDRYAGWVSVALIASAVLLPLPRRWVRRWVRR